jgi:hypothetical protein
LLREGTRFQRESIGFAGLIYGHQRLVGIGQMLEDLTLTATATEALEAQTTKTKRTPNPFKGR